MYLLTDKSEFIREIQRFLSRLSQDDSLPHLAVDGIYTAETEAAVKEFQKQNNLTITGKVEQKTFELLYQQYLNSLAEFHNFNPESFPLKIGDAGNDVLMLNTYIRELSEFYRDLKIEWSDFFSANTEESVNLLQEYFRTEKTGEVTQKFMLKIQNELVERQKFSSR